MTGEITRTQAASMMPSYSVERGGNVAAAGPLPQPIWSGSVQDGTSSPHAA